VIEPTGPGFFVGGYYGKQRRTTEVDLPDDDIDTGVDFSFCDPIVGFKGGPTFMMGENWQVAPAFGVAFNIDENDRTAVFVEAEFNYLYDNGALIGFGGGVYDLFDGDDIAPHVLIHFGVPLWREDVRKLLFAVEGRLFLNEIDNIEDNYQFWGGLRYQFR
jgi:hypothetical protein